ncbi:18171_t:CDS:1, partial [Funneliformis geosporum]
PKFAVINGIAPSELPILLPRVYSHNVESDFIEKEYHTKADSL